MIMKNLNNKNDLSLENIFNSNVCEDEDLEDIRQIINEIGFSYESLSLALGNYEVNYKAIDEFFDLHEEKLVKHMINMAGTKNDVDKIGSIERLPIEKITATRKIYFFVSEVVKWISRTYVEHNTDKIQCSTWNITLKNKRRTKNIMFHVEHYAKNRCGT